MNYQDFNFLSEGFLDNIIFFDNDTLAVGNTLVPTGITERFLPFLIYSVDGSTWYKGGTTPYDSSGSPMYSVNAFCYSGGVMISSDTTGYYQLLGVPK